MTIEERLETIYDTKKSLRTSIENKLGYSIDNTLVNYPSYVDKIKTTSSTTIYNINNYSGRFSEDIMNDSDYPDLRSIPTEAGETYFVLDNTDGFLSGRIYDPICPDNYNKLFSPYYLYITGDYNDSESYKFTICTGKIVDNAFVSDENEVSFSKTKNDSTYDCYHSDGWGNDSLTLGSDKYIIVRFKSNDYIRTRFAYDSAVRVLETLVHSINKTQDFGIYFADRNGANTPLFGYSRKITIKSAKVRLDSLFASNESLEDLKFVDCIYSSNTDIFDYTFFDCFRLRIIDFTGLSIDTKLDVNNSILAMFANSSYNLEVINASTIFNLYNYSDSTAINSEHCLRYCDFLDLTTMVGKGTFDNIVSYPVFNTITESLSYLYNCVYLNQETLLNILNYLCETEETLNINISTASRCKLTDANIAIATEKGWTVLIS